MMDKKTTVIANFNCTFGQDNKPMLTYFDKIIYPAFTEDYFRKVKDDTYFFKDAKLVELDNGRMILQGIYVRRTRLEVKTEYNPIKNELEFTNKFYNSAPISIFTLFLDNHTLLYTTNQKGSPNIRSFGATIKDIVKQVITVYNDGKIKEKRIPMPEINIVDIPSSDSIEEKFKMVKKIRKLQFRFFNPNGDIGSSDAVSWMYGRLDTYNSKIAQISFNQPQNIDKVKDDVKEINGLAKIKLEVDFKNGSKGKLDNNSLSEKFEIDMDENESIENVASIAVATLQNNSIIKEIGQDNKKIYEMNKNKIDKFLR